MRFFGTDMRHLELLLSAIEAGSPEAIEEEAAAVRDPSPTGLHAADLLPVDVWQWEERYVTLLWLSQLLLAPFDLVSISSQGTGDGSRPVIPGLTWPNNVPGVTLRVIPLAIRHLSSSGKESAAAKVLLVRVAMRRDMQKLGILHNLVAWAKSCLRVTSKSTDEHSTYHVVGILSFLAAVLAASVGTADMDAYIGTIFRVFEDITSGADSPDQDTLFFKAIRSSAVTRKIIIKIFRTIVLLLLRKSGNLEEADPALLHSIGGADAAQMMVAQAIGQLLEYVEDQATPVRLAASKALSMITLKLSPEMGIQVVDAVLDMLRQNVLLSADKKTQDLARVNPLAWHGLILTLSHIVYRHSPPVNSLPEIISCLLVGLSFQQRTSTGASVGTNVRDAACFGIWALARRYKTEELQAIQLEASFDDEQLIGNGMKKLDVLQTLATRLVVSASLDPSGNIRRGSSAALQELIGRHPDTIIEGIQVVQVVDYHAVARRSRALQQVAFQAAGLSDLYCSALLDGLLGWRGVKDADASTRRIAASAFGSLAWLLRCQYDLSRMKFCSIISTVNLRMRKLVPREVEGRHGLLLCLASTLQHLRQDLSKEKVIWKPETSIDPGFLRNQLRSILDMMETLLTDMNMEFLNYRRPELIAEATSRLITATYPLLRADCVFRAVESYPTYANSIDFIDYMQPFTSLLDYPCMAFSTTQSASLAAVQELQIVIDAGHPPDQEIVSQAAKLLVPFHHLDDEECAEAVSETAANSLLFIGEGRRQQLIEQFESCFLLKAEKKYPGRGSLYTLFKILPLCSDEKQRTIIHEIRTEAWRPRKQNTRHIDTCATILRCLSQSSILKTQISESVGMVAEGLDDFTTDARGDVGSIIRIEATKAAGVLWKDGKFILKTRFWPFPRASIASIPSGLQTYNRKNGRNFSILESITTISQGLLS